jgi:hypothetical protein
MPSPHFGGSSPSFWAGHRRSAANGRGGGGRTSLRSASNSKKKGGASFRRMASAAPTFWIGIMTCFLAAVYVLVVLVVTRFHMFHLQPPPPPAPSSHENNNIIKQNVRQNSGGAGTKHHAGGSTPKDRQHHPSPEFVLKAYVEPTNVEEWEVKPLPRRSKAQKSLLNVIEYPQLNRCSLLPEQWPVNDDDAVERNSQTGHRRGNPVDADPFLPWIHDAFPTDDGHYVQFVAQNRRRCHTGVRERHVMDRMQPQAALFQHVSVKRVNNNGTAAAAGTTTSTRYKVVPYEQADADGITTRFICRFKQSLKGGPLPAPRQAETLAIHNFDYDWTGFRKRYKAAFLKDDGGIKSIHTTQLLFRCPVPHEWQHSVRNGSTVINDYATLFVDVIPIRTPPRYGTTNRYLAPWFAEFNIQSSASSADDKFDFATEIGNDHVLPAIEDSGRWENVPICLPSLMAYEGQKAADLPPPPPNSPYDTVRDSTAMASVPLQSQVQKHRLVSCIWASSGYATRGERFSINDGQRRLMEWLHHNINIGFDHFYLYDNSDAFDGNTNNNLKGIADLFPDHVTYINWPSKVRSELTGMEGIVVVVTLVLASDHLCLSFFALLHRFVLALASGVQQPPQQRRLARGAVVPVRGRVVVPAPVRPARGVDRSV